MLRWVLRLTGINLLILGVVMGWQPKKPFYWVLYRNDAYDNRLMLPDGSTLHSLPIEGYMSVEWGLNGRWLYGSDGIESSYVDLDGQLTPLLGETPAHVYNFIPAPDRQQAAFINSAWQQDGLYVIAADGQHYEQLLVDFEPTIDRDSLYWSPDSRWLYFTACTHPIPTCHLYRRGMVAPFSLEQGPAVPELTALSRTSPDGKWGLLYPLSQRHTFLYLMRFSDMVTVQLPHTGTPMEYYVAEFLPDSSGVIYKAADEITKQAYVFSVTDHTVRTVTIPPAENLVAVSDQAILALSGDSLYQLDPSGAGGTLIFDRILSYCYDYSDQRVVVAQQEAQGVQILRYDLHARQYQRLGLLPDLHPDACFFLYSPMPDELIINTWLGHMTTYHHVDVKTGELTRLPVGNIDYYGASPLIDLPYHPTHPLIAGLLLIGVSLIRIRQWKKA